MFRGCIGRAFETPLDNKEVKAPKEVKAQPLKELAQKDPDDKEWYDMEMDKNLNKG